MPALRNYLQTNRKRASLSQEEVAFLLGICGMNKGSKVSRDEHSARVPTLETALAYEAIYNKPIRDLFAGMYENIAQKVAERAKILSHRKDVSADPKKSRLLTQLAVKCHSAVVRSAVFVPNCHRRFG
jgi:transcriptional regulator with XRE-family HTH domain